MCGRYVFVPDENIFERFEIPTGSAVLDANYNVAPGMTMPVVVGNGSNEFKFMLWGLIPPWAEEEKSSYTMINARSETVDEKPTFKRPFRSQRCLVPISGFYEWQQREEGKQPHFIYPESGGVVALAGLYEKKPEKTGGELLSYTILTTAASANLKSIHDRMPVILTREEETEWLAPGTHPERLKEILQPNSRPVLKKHPVSSRVNSPKNNSPELIQPSER